MQMIQVFCQYACSYTPRWCYNQEEGSISASANSKIHKRDDYPPIIGTLWKTTRREDRRIVRQALVDPTVTRSTIRADVEVAIVPQTISRHLAEAHLKSKRHFRALPLTPEHRQLRLQWCQARSMWNVRDWQKVVFSDESRIVLGTDDNRVRGGALTLPWPDHSPYLSPVEHMWDQLKRQMPSCHSVHDLELAA
ncbi:HTH_Tnp_Tc3_2 domain-containing protein [Trichonephila clavipes]|nr:HTH_Tnp_Tc3_2 domain-containing protein [Trichonephila clavipes]